MSNRRQMPADAAAPPTQEPTDGAGGATLYQVIVRALQTEIVRGVYPVGTQLPSESALAERFGVSRQTVRQALRALREARLVRTHQGLGTLVEGPDARQGYVHQINEISDLFPLGVETRYDPSDEALIPLPAWARFTPQLNQERTWAYVRGLGYRAGEATPFNEVEAFTAARFAEVRALGPSAGSIHTALELAYGETIGELEQFISGFKATPERGVSLGLEPGEIGIEIRRIYRAALDNDIALVSFNRFRPDDFTSSMTLRRTRN